MKYQFYYQPIDIEKSEPNNKSLIMPHQQEAVEALTNYFCMEKNLPDRNGLLIMPTGSGKTYTSVKWLMQDAVARGYRVVWLVHRQELVNQAYREFVAQAPTLKGTGIKKIRILPVSGIHMHMSTASRADVYVCSIASVANKYGYRFIERMIGAQGKRKLVIVIDEAHHAIASNYQKVIRRMTALNPNRVLLGLTATPKRMQDAEQRRLQKMFNVDANILKKKGMNGFVYEVTMAQLLASGFLAKPIPEKVETKIVGDVTFEITDKDREYFAQYGELSEKLMDEIGRNSVRNKIILDEYLQNADRYGKTIVFAINQNHARTLYEDFKKAGVSVDYVVSSKSDNIETIQRFKKNEFQVLINVQILTEGSDVPDIQTVFLTRETNSEALLRQMIGRGLRGPKAGGTETANIVSFYDIWDRFGSFMDPCALDIFAPEEDEQELEEEPIKPALVPDEVMLEYLRNLVEADKAIVAKENYKADENSHEMDDTASWNISDLYLKLYSLMKASLESNHSKPEVPDGWYSVMDEEGNEIRVIVFQSQLDGYNSMTRNQSLLARGTNLIGEDLIDTYFGDSTLKPSAFDLDSVLQYIQDTGTMPEYFELKERESLDPSKLADNMKAMFTKESDIENWLKEFFESAPILQNIYKTFFAFKKTVFDCMKDDIKEDIEAADWEKEQYNIVENYYDLSELMAELAEMFPRLRQDQVIRVEWSRNVVKDWFALCTRSTVQGDHFQIHVNKVFSSPDVDREVIKYLLFHELLHANGYWKHDLNKFRNREWQYPNSEELDGFMEELRIRYDMEDIWKNAIRTENYLEDGTVEQISSGNVIITTEENTLTPASESVREDKPYKEENSSDDRFNPNAKGVSSGFKYCRNCGHKVPESTKFCDKCGEKMDY